MESYTVSLEVAGPAAMFARPDTGSTPVSYPVPTWSAAKGMFEAVAWLRSAYFHPIQVEVCQPVRYERYVTNYGGPLRKTGQFRDGNNYQLYATILVDVHYVIEAEIRGKRSTRGDGRMKQRSGGRDHVALLKEVFEKRLSSGQTFYTPCLGWKEFVPSYFGPRRPETQREESVNADIPSLLMTMWDHRKLRPSFGQDWHVVGGLMSYRKSISTEDDDA